MYIYIYTCMYVYLTYIYIYHQYHHTYIYIYVIHKCIDVCISVSIVYRLISEIHGMFSMFWMPWCHDAMMSEPRGCCRQPLFVAFHFNPGRHCGAMDDFHGSANVLRFRFSSRAVSLRINASCGCAFWRLWGLCIAVQVCQFDLGNFFQFLHRDGADYVSASPSHEVYLQCTSVHLLQ